MSRWPDRMPGVRGGRTGCRGLGAGASWKRGPVATSVGQRVEMERVLTERLDLRRPDPSGDLDALFGIFSDPAGWWYEPAGRHSDPEQTRQWLTRAAARFETDQLSYWTVRRRDTGAIIGVGGAQRQRTGAWNLNYRIATAEQGHGYATELARAAYAAASALDPSAPFVAWIAPHNAPSRKVAERLGLTNRGLGIDPSDGQRRLAYGDRPLPEAEVASADDVNSTKRGDGGH